MLLSKAPVVLKERKKDGQNDSLLNFCTTFVSDLMNARRCTVLKR